MESYDQIISFIDTNLVYCLIPMILTLMLINLLFKNRFSTKKALNIIRWFIVVYTAITLLHFIIGIIFHPDDFAFVKRATGPYKVTYWIMFLSAALFPFTLLIKKLASKFWYVLLIAFLMKIGLYFERYVIIVTSLHRDYLPPSETTNSFNFPFFGLSMLVLQGFLLAIITLGIVEMMKLKTKT